MTELIQEGTVSPSVNPVSANTSFEFTVKSWIPEEVADTHFNGSARKLVQTPKPKIGS